MILNQEPAGSHLQNMTAKPANLTTKRESGILRKSVKLVVHRSEACYKRGKLKCVLLWHLIHQHNPKLRNFNRNTKSGRREGKIRKRERAKTKKKTQLQIKAPSFFFSFFMTACLICRSREKHLSPIMSSESKMSLIAQGCQGREGNVGTFEWKYRKTRHCLREPTK